MGIQRRGPIWHSGCQRLGLRDSTTSHVGTAEARLLKRLLVERAVSRQQQFLVGRLAVAYFIVEA